MLCQKQLSSQSEKWVQTLKIVNLVMVSNMLANDSNDHYKMGLFRQIFRGLATK